MANTALFDLRYQTKIEREAFVSLLRSAFYSQVNVPPREITSLVYSEMGGLEDEDNESFRRRVRNALREMPEATYNRSSRRWTFEERDEPDDLTSPRETSQKGKEVQALQSCDQSWEEGMSRENLAEACQELIIILEETIRETRPNVLLLLDKSDGGETEKTIDECEEMIAIFRTLEAVMKPEVVNLPQLLYKSALSPSSSGLADSPVGSQTSLSTPGSQTSLSPSISDVDFGSDFELLSMENTPKGFCGGATRLGDHNAYVFSKLEPFLNDLALCPETLSSLVQRKRAKMLHNECLPAKKRVRENETESPYHRKLHLKAAWHAFDPTDMESWD